MSSGTGYRPQSYLPDGLSRMLETLRSDVEKLKRYRAPVLNLDEQDPDEIVLAGSRPRLLCMSATGDSIASGGDAVTFDTIIADHGWDAVAGASFTHPVGGVYVLTYEHVWDGYQGGGVIQLLLDDVPVPEGLIASALEGEHGTKTICYVAEAGAVGTIGVAQSSGLAQTCSAVMWVAVPDPTLSATPDPGPTPIETFWFDSKSSSAASTMTLTNGVEYRLVVTGNCRESDSAYAYGSPDTIMYPSPGEPTEQAGNDAEVSYASPLNISLPAHNGVSFVMSTGSGFVHVEPIGGSVSTPSPGHSYEYQVTGTGAVLQVKWTDSAYTDNNGMFRIDIHEV